MYEASKIVVLFVGYYEKLSIFAGTKVEYLCREKLSALSASDVENARHSMISLQSVSICAPSVALKCEKSCRFFYESWVSVQDQKLSNPADSRESWASVRGIPESWVIVREYPEKLSVCVWGFQKVRCVAKKAYRQNDGTLSVFFSIFSPHRASPLLFFSDVFPPAPVLPVRGLFLYGRG